MDSSRFIGYCASVNGAFALHAAELVMLWG